MKVGSLLPPEVGTGLRGMPLTIPRPLGLGILGEHYFEHNTLVYGVSIMLDYTSIIYTF